MRRKVEPFLEKMGDNEIERVLITLIYTSGVEGTSTVAIKTLRENAGERERKDLLSELEVMKMLEPHPNVVTLLGCCTEKGKQTIETVLQDAKRRNQ